MNPTLTRLVERVGSPDSGSDLVVLLGLLLLLLCLLLLEDRESSDPDSDLLVLFLVLDLTFALTHRDSHQLGPAIPPHRCRPPIRMAGVCGSGFQHLPCMMRDQTAARGDAAVQTRIPRIVTNSLEARRATNARVQEISKVKTPEFRRTESR